MNMDTRTTPTQRNPVTLKHHRVLETLRRQIIEGHYAPGSRLPTENELPGLLRAGKQTVVRALNELVHEGLIVRRRGDGSYVAERQAPPLMPGRHLKLGLLWHRSVFPERLEAYFQGLMTRGALTALGLENTAPDWTRVDQKQPTRVTWTSITRGVTAVAIGESKFSHARHPDLAAVRAENFDGLLSLSIIESGWLEDLLGFGIPTVFVDFPNERFAARADQVYVDPLPGYRAAVLALAQAGAKRIHFMGSNMVAAAPSAEMEPSAVFAYQKGRDRVDPDSLLRLHAFRAGMDEAGLQVTEGQIHFCQHSSEAALAERLLAMPRMEQPDAFVCHSAGQAQRMQAIFAAHGVHVWGAGAVDRSFNGTVLPIHIDGAELGRTATELLIWKLQRPQRSALRVGVAMELQGSQQPVPASVEGHHHAQNA